MNNYDHLALSARLKQLIADQFRIDLPGSDFVSNHEPLMGDRLGLDSLDAIELAMSIEEEFGITIHSRAESLNAFASIATLTDFIHARTSGDATSITETAAA